jgi:hypothetical protein
MNEIKLVVKKFLKALKKLKLYIIKYYNLFIKSKETVDTIYVSAIQDNIKETKNFDLKLKDIHSKNIILEKEVLNLKTSISKKKKIIDNLQELTSRRSDY